MWDRVLVVSARMGAGHDGAAKELRRRLEANGAETRQVDFLDAAPWAGHPIRWVYEAWLRWTPWAYEATYRIWFVLPLLVGPIVSLLALAFGRRIKRWAEEMGATVVVSTYPLASVVLGRLREKGKLDSPVITFVTDFAIHPLWVHKGVDLHLCVHESSARAVAASTGGEVVVTGPLVAEAFRKLPLSREEARQRLKIPSDAKVALLVAGSWGVGDLEVAWRLLVRSGQWYPVAICGNNAKLQRKLAGLGGGRAVGWTDEMPLYMRAADVLVQNAGGLTSMEAFAVGLPVVTYRPIPGHGRENALAMEAAGVAPFVREDQRLLAELDLAMARRKEVRRLNSAMFAGDAAEEVLDVARRLGAPVGVVVKRRRQLLLPIPLRRAAIGIAGLLTLWVGVNIGAGAAIAGSFSGVKVLPSPQAYVAVRVGPKDISDQALVGLLAAKGITAVVYGRLAEVNPQAVRELAFAGVPLANGGWGDEGDLHLLGESTLPLAVRALRHVLGFPVPLAILKGSPSLVDYAFSRLEHLEVLEGAVALGPTGPLPRLKKGIVYVVDLERDSGPEALARLEAILAKAQGERLAIAGVPEVS